MSYIIDLGCWQSVFAVPSELVDRHLRLANAAHIKVILYILRHAGERIDSELIGEAVGLSTGDIEDALAYWQTCGLLARCGDTFVPPEYSSDAPAAEPAIAAAVSAAPTPAEPVTAPAAQQADIAGNAEPSKPKRVERVRYSYSECAEYISSSSELREMLPILEGLLQKQLNHTEISVFVTLVHWYGLPTPCVALLVEYCKSIGKGTIAYIESTGIGWAGEEINTVELASKKIDRLRSINRAWQTVRTALDIPERKPSKKEEEYCCRWINEYGICIDLIKLAFDRCIDKKGKLSMSYMNGIIENWHRKGIKTVEQAEGEDGGSGTSPAAAPGRHQPTYDKSEIELVMYDEWFGDDSDL